MRGSQQLRSGGKRLEASQGVDVSSFSWLGDDGGEWSQSAGGRFKYRHCLTSRGEVVDGLLGGRGGENF